MNEPPQRHPFHHWVDAARARKQLWRTAAGLTLVILIWALWSLALVYVAVGTGLVESNALGAMFGAAHGPATYDETVKAVLLTLATIWGFAIGVWVVLRFLHKRPLRSVASWNGRFAAREFGVGCALAAGYLCVSLLLSALNGNLPRRSEVNIEAWLVSLGPLAVVIFLQGASEELVFRGYLPQQLAARFGSSLVWGLLPSIAFGAMHAGNMPGDPSFASYLIVSATVLGLVMMATVWRTGSLATAMGLHFVNNVAALTVAGADAGSSTLALFVWPPDDLMRGAMNDLLVMGALLAFVLSPWAPLPKKP